MVYLSCTMKINLTHNFLRNLDLSTFGVELGNWYGFSGIPMGTGIASFQELIRYHSNIEVAELVARVRMKELNIVVTLNCKIDGDYLLVRFEAEALTDSLLGDLVIHYSFFDTDRNVVSIAGEPLLKADKYIEITDKDYEIALGDNKSFRSQVSVSIPDDVDLEYRPYATLMRNGKVRHHVRLICKGGDSSYIIFRTRGSMSSFKLCKYKKLFGKYLYRKELSAPKIFPNTQLCAVTTLKKGSRIFITQKIKVI